MLVMILMADAYYVLVSATAPIHELCELGADPCVRILVFAITHGHRDIVTLQGTRRDSPRFL